MDPVIALPALALMLVGLAGVVLPLLPGLVLVLVGIVGSMALAGWSSGAWVVAILAALIFAAAQASQYVLPARAGRGAGAPRSSVLIGAALGAVGFFVIPLVGFLIGGVGGIYLAERSRLGSHDAAWRTTWAVMRSIGLAAAVQIAAGILMIGVWLTYVLIGS